MSGRSENRPRPYQQPLSATAQAQPRWTGGPGVRKRSTKLQRYNKADFCCWIGYAACHWCHVMAHESFEDEETAAVMNRLFFVNIKVDREDRSDME